MQGNRVQLTAAPRTAFGKKNRALRRAGWVPANIFGRGTDSVAVQIETRDIEHLLAHVSRNTLLSVRVDGSEETVLIRGVSRKPTTDELYHVDFFRVSLTETVRATVPITLVGEAPAVKQADAVILRSLDSVEVEAYPQNLPRQIEVDLGGLAEIDDAIHVRDLNLPPGVTVITDGDEMVVKAQAPTLPEVEEVVEAEEAAAEAPQATTEGEATAEETEEARE